MREDECPALFVPFSVDPLFHDCPLFLRGCLGTHSTLIVLQENYLREVQGVSMGARAGSESGECDTAPMQVQTFFTAAAEMCGGTPWSRI